MADRVPNPNDFDRSQLKKAEPVQKPQVVRTKIKNESTGKTTYNTTKTPEKAAADKAAGQNSNIGKVITGPQGAKFDFTETKSTTPEQRSEYAKSRAEHAAKIAANQARQGSQADHHVTDNNNHTKPVTPAQKQAEAKRPMVGTDKSAAKKYGASSHNNGYTN
jgi:hypothetical protein